MWEAQAQLGIDGAGPHEVGRDLVSADEAFPVAMTGKEVRRGRVASRLRNKPFLLSSLWLLS